MKTSLMVLQFEKQSAREFAESHEFSVELYVPSYRELHLVKNSRETFYIVTPSGDRGHRMVSEELAWEFAALVAKCMTDEDARYSRNQWIKLVTPEYWLMDVDPLEYNDSFEKSVCDVVDDSKAKRNARQGARSIRLADLRLRQEREVKKLPSGRTNSLKFLKKLTNADKE